MFSVPPSHRMVPVVPLSSHVAVSAHLHNSTFTPLCDVNGCDLQGRKINFTNSKTLVDVATDRDARYL